MRPRDPLAAIRLLRRIQLEGARQHLAQARDAEIKAADRQARAATALTTEGHGSAAADFVAWLPAAQKELADAAHEGLHAAAAFAVAQQALAAAGRAEHAVSEEARHRASAARMETLRRDQLQLDSLAAPPLKAPLA